jgi:hypothetical protein
MKVDLKNRIYKHEGGTKYYRLMQLDITNAAGHTRSMVIRNWGPVKDSELSRMAPRYGGQNKVDRHTSSIHAIADFDKEHRNRGRRDYAVAANDDVSFNVRDQKELENVLFNTHGFSSILLVDEVIPHFKDFLALGGDGDPKTAPWEGTPAPLKTPKPEPVVEKHADWGSW